MRRKYLREHVPYRARFYTNGARGEGKMPQSFIGWLNSDPAQSDGFLFRRHNRRCNLPGQLEFSDITLTASVSQNGLITIYGTGLVLIKAKMDTFEAAPSATYQPGYFLIYDFPIFLGVGIVANRSLRVSC